MFVGRMPMAHALCCAHSSCSAHHLYQRKKTETDRDCRRTVGEGKPSAGIACLPHLCFVGAVPRVCIRLLNICVSQQVVSSLCSTCSLTCSRTSDRTHLTTSIYASHHEQISTRLKYASESLHMSRREQKTVYLSQERGAR